MVIVEHGKVQDGGVILSKPVDLPEGTEVVVRIEPLAAGGPADAPNGPEALVDLPFFGMWADRPDMDDGAAWVRSERERWQQRTRRGD